MTENNSLEETEDLKGRPLKRNKFDRFITALAVLLIIVGFSLAVYGVRPLYSWVQFKLKIYPYAKDKKAIAQGERLYQRWCQNCHGKLSRRAHPLKLFTRHHFPADYYRHIIRHPKAGGLASKKSLSSGVHWKIVSYIFAQSYPSSEKKSEGK